MLLLRGEALESIHNEETTTNSTSPKRSDGVSNRDIVRSPLLPGGDLLSAVLDRKVMALADRGAASSMIGQRWADVCAEWVDTGQDRTMPVPGGQGNRLTIERAVRLDAHPEIANRASRRGLQNPDWLFIGTMGGIATIQAADAKFSVETARIKQVSPSVVEALLAVPDLLQTVTGPLPEDIEIVPGIFLCPDSTLSHIMLRRRHGIVRVTVTDDDIEFVPATAGRFFRGMPGFDLMPLLADIDALPVDLARNLLAGLYYFRLARAAVGCWIDSSKPLLMLKDQVAVDEEKVLAEARRRAGTAASALDLILDWDADVQTIRSERQAIDQVAALPMSGRELRALIIRRVAVLGGEAPSVNQVRRRLGGWYRAALRAQVGPLYPPVANLSDTLLEVAAAGRALTPELHRQARHVIDELIAAPQGNGDDAAIDSPIASSS
jgi:hypothetical protein